MTSESNTAPRLRYQLLAATAARAVINTAHRMFYPFLPVISRGLGVPPAVLDGMLSFRGLYGMSAPAFGPLVDRFGKRNALLIGLGIFCLGLSLAGVFSNVATVLAAILLVITCKFIFDPALQSYLSERTPYARRGLTIALSEIGWSGAVLVGVPVVGFLIDRFGWRAAFLPLAAAGAAAALITGLVIPADGPHPNPPAGNGFAQGLAVLRHPAVRAALAADLLISAANESFSVIYGQWLEAGFRLSASQLGLTTIVIGVAELLGEGGVAWLSDRLGKRRTLLLGLAVSALAYLLLPVISTSLVGALTGIFLVYLTFEFAIVASLPLISELLPASRNAVMSTAIASHAAGRMTGALLGALLFNLGLMWNGGAAALLTLGAIPLLVFFVRENH